MFTFFILSENQKVELEATCIDFMVLSLPLSLFYLGKVLAIAVGSLNSLQPGIDVLFITEYKHTQFLYISVFWILLVFNILTILSM